MKRLTIKNDFDVMLDDRLVGKLIGSKYYTQRKPQHFFIKYRGFGISNVILNFLKDNGIKSIIIAYMGKKGIILYHSSLDSFMNLGETYVDNYNDSQKVLGINSMEVVNDENKDA